MLWCQSGGGNNSPEGGQAATGPLEVGRSSNARHVWPTRSDRSAKAMKTSFKSRVPLAAALCAAMMATAACGASSEVRQAVAERSKSSLQGSGGWSDAYPADGQGTA